MSDLHIKIEPEILDLFTGKDHQIKTLYNRQSILTNLCLIAAIGCGSFVVWQAFQIDDLNHRVDSIQSTCTCK